MGPRPHLLLQVLVAALALGGAAVGLDRGATTRLPPGSPTGQVQLLRLLDSLPTPQDAVRDPYATACGVPSRFCVSSSTHGASTVADAVVDLLRKHGARVVDHRCDTTCVDLLVVDGVGVEVQSGDRVGTSADVSVPAYAAVVLPAHALLQPVGAPLPPLALLRLQPPPPVVVRCVEPRGAGCMRYAGGWPGPGTASEVEGRWRDLLVSYGYRLDDESCDAVAGGRRCQVAATKFRTFGGLDPVLVRFVAEERVGQRLRSSLSVSTTGAR